MRGYDTDRQTDSQKLKKSQFWTKECPPTKIFKISSMYRVRPVSFIIIIEDGVTRPTPSYLLTNDTAIVKKSSWL